MICQKAPVSSACIKANKCLNTYVTQNFAQRSSLLSTPLSRYDNISKYPPTLNLISPTPLGGNCAVENNTLMTLLATIRQKQ